MTPPHAALLLAAGGSRRLGQPKQLLRRDGTVLIRHAALLALATQPDRLTVVLGAEATSMREALRGLPLNTVINADWASGMASSLRLGAQALEGHTGPVLVLGVDQPALNAPHLQALLSAFDGHRDVASGYAGILGIPAVLSPKTVARAGEIDGDRGFGALLRTATPPAVMIDNERLALDVDTPETLAQARLQGWLDPA